MSTVPPEPPNPKGPPFTSWGARALQPDVGVYITRDDRIILRFRSSFGVNLTLRARVQQPEDGRVVPYDFQRSTSGVRTPEVLTFDLSEGYLLGVEILTSTAGVTRGMLYVEASLIRGGLLATDRVQKLCAGYVETGQTITWPGGDFEDPLESQGRLYHFVGIDPAAGAEFSQVVPTGARWRIHGFRIALVTDATVAARRVHLIVDDTANILADLAALDTQAASLTRNYNMASCGFQRTAQDLEVYVPLYLDLRLPAGFRIRTLTTALQAGDNFGVGRFLLEEWLEE